MRVMLLVEDVDLTAVKYKHEVIQAPHLTGFALKSFVWLVEAPLVGSLILSLLKKQNRTDEVLRRTVIPEKPMFKPEFPPQENEPGVIIMEEESRAGDRVELALKCLPPYDPACHWSGDSFPFLYWKIRDYAHAYRYGHVTPLMVAEKIISVMDEFNKRNPPIPFLISFDAEELRTHATASTQRFEEGEPLSILDGIFMVIKDDIDCYPYPTKGARTWYHEIRPV